MRAAGPLVMVKLVATVSSPVVTVTVRPPVVVVGLTVTFAVRCVESETTIELTVMPAPKVTPVEPWTKFVNTVAIATSRFCCPCEVLAGLMVVMAGVPAVTLKPLAADAASPWVISVTVRVPMIAPGAMLIIAVADVAVPIDRLFTVMPVPKSAIVTPCAKCVADPTMATLRFD